MIPVSRYQPLQHYDWGAGCDGWNLVDEASLSVKQERMPAGAEETRHYHAKAQQFFFILKGTATFYIETSIITVQAGEGLHIRAGVNHKIGNMTTEDLEFLLCSQPSAAQDRVNCD